MYQQVAWNLTIILVLAFTAVFIFVALSGRKQEDYDPIVKKAYRLRTVWFFVLLLGLSTALYVTLPKIPYDKAAASQGQAPLVVDVTAQQFGWALSTDKFKLGQPVEFRVTSKDVNHGFGIYDENMKLIAQTQAMPNYTNNLVFIFSKPGTYQILCLEYCGVGHHVMIGKFEVKPNNQGGL